MNKTNWFKILNLVYILILSNHMLFANEKFVIGTHCKCGMFSIFFGALNNIHWCEKNNRTPVVYWDSSTTYYDNTGEYYSNENAWEYYFEPISSAKYKIGDKIYNRYEDPSNEMFVPSLMRGCHSWQNKTYRLTINKFINKYIKFKPHILSKVDNYYNYNILGRPTIGIHLRGTDKFNEVAQTPVEAICDKANKIADDYPGCQFFIATDDQRLLDKAKELLKGDLIYYDVYRSLNGSPIHYGRNNYNRSKMGEEVVIEAILLSRCDCFVHTCSNVAGAVLFFNPHLKNIFMY